jgi:signal transduction histidine kinase
VRGRFAAAFSSLPLAVRVPLLVVALTVGVAVIISNVVLARFADVQEEQLCQVARVYLDGLSAGLGPHVLRRDVWEAYDLLDRARALYTDIAATSAVVALPDDTVLAASDPKLHLVGERLRREFLHSFAAEGALVIDKDDARARSLRILREGNEIAGTLYAEFDISHQLEVRRGVFWALVGMNGLVAVLAAAVGYKMVRRMLAPLGVLSTYLARARSGGIAAIPESEMKPPGTEFGRLFLGFNAMAEAVSEREALRMRRAEEEKLILLGKLAAGMAHEVNNPLGGLLNTVDTLRRHGADAGARAASLNLLERGLIGIRDVVHTALITYRDRGENQKIAARDLDDLRHLVAHESERRGVCLDWTNAAEGEILTNGAQIRQALLNLLLNACAASPPGGAVKVEIGKRNGRLTIAVTDQGPGLPEDIRAIYAGRDAAGDMLRPGGGLGAWTARRLMDALGGEIDIETEPGRGTRIMLTVPLAGERRLHAVA